MTSTEQQRPSASIRPRRARRIVTEETGVAGALIVLVAVIAALHPDFLQFHSVMALLRDSAYVGLMAYGMVFLLSMQELDLSVGSLFGLSAIVCAMAIRGGVDPWLAAGLTLILGALLGMANAGLANLLAIPGIIVTLGTLSVFRGADLVLSGGGPVIAPGTGPFFDLLGGSLLGVPTSVWVLVLVGAILHVVYRWTRFGVLVRAVGSNARAAAFAGIPVGRVRLQAFALTGVLCAMAGVLSVAFFGSADPSLGLGQEIVVIAAAIIGGTALSGGSGTVAGAFLGTLLIAVISAGLVYFGVNASWGTLITGLVIIAAVGLDSALRRRIRLRRAG